MCATKRYNAYGIHLKSAEFTGSYALAGLKAPTRKETETI